MASHTITPIQLRAFEITDVRGLDPIRVILQDLAPSQGRIIVECYGQAWAAYFGSMSGRTISRFIADCDVAYISNAMESNAEMADFYQYDSYRDRVMTAVREALRDIEGVKGHD